MVAFRETMSAGCVRAVTAIRTRGSRQLKKKNSTILDLYNKIIEQENSFNYLGNMLSYEKELDIDNKLHNYLKITGIINNVFRPQKNP